MGFDHVSVGGDVLKSELSVPAFERQRLLEQARCLKKKKTLEGSTKSRRL